ncbi:c-type cytochrome [Solimicrobium silvestre]|uniref:Cytochrome c n=1 Tax=Solimicrobium silvestre TaxID=2099400 RepID=A0A2S9GZZ9_9BURK|nr:c-type cytochrome [Solimicrobium silvestre]PRC93196.1 Cytochrome c [Solimicrobium silvestre]
MNILTMNHLNLSKLVALSAILAISACSSPERSRNLNDASIPVSTTALQVCSNCHGMHGVSTSPNFPNLAAQTQPYIVNQLTAFRSHGRSDPEGFEYMWGLSSHLSDAQINGLASYFSSLPPPSGNVDKAGTPAMLTDGRTIFEQGIEAQSVPACSACHGAHAEGADQFPRLAGQHADYLVKQLMVFQLTNQRPDGIAMKAVTHNLTPESIANVAAYLESMAPMPK